MSRLLWDQDGQKKYEMGVEQVALYPQDLTGTYPEGVAWNGITGATMSPSGAEPTSLYANNTKYVTLMSNEELGGTIEAYTYPAEFEQCDGSATIALGATAGQQTRKPFGLAVKTKIGNDTDSDSHGYKLHLLYGCKASPSEKAYSTVNDSPEAVTFSWEITTTPVPVAGFKPTSSVEIDSTTANATNLATLENILYGTDEIVARLPLPAEVITILNHTETPDEQEPTEEG